MKKLIIYMSMAFLFVGCSSNASTSENTTPAEITAEDSYDPIDAPVTSASEDVTVDFGLISSWENDANSSYKYLLTLNNNGDTDYNDWVVNITFSDDVTLDSGWNSKFEINENVLTLYPADYNAVIPANDSVTDIGFIINGSADLEITNIEVQ